MLRKLLIGSAIAMAAVAGSAGTGHAEVNWDFGIRFGSQPQFVQVPETPVSYAPSVAANLFLYDGQYFAFRGGVWLASSGYQGPWSEVPPQYVPRPILAVPVRYYHERPREWAQWHREAAPRWAPTWGNRWEDRHTAHPAVYRDDHRGEHHTVYRDDPRDDRRYDRTRAYRDEHRYWRYDDRR